MNLKISAIDIYHPKTIRDNNYYIDKFKNNNKIIEILKKVGRNKRYVISDQSENALTMAINASEQVLKNQKIDDGNIDIIIFASTTLEYLSPTNALLLHSALNIKQACVCFDINANCLGMFLALEQASVLLNSKTSYQRALVVAADHLTKIGCEDTLIPSTIVGDAAAAMILEKTNDNSGSGMIDRVYQTDSRFKDTIVLPPRGFSNSNTTYNEKIHWDIFSGIESVEFAAEALDTLLNNNNLKMEDISCFLLSQFTKYNIELLQEKKKIPWNKIEYIGDQYGYTGANSLFIAYASRLKKGLIKKGDIVVFWTLGAGYQTGLMLWKI
ncbi:3-oxoacyl-[acyl-carrier-protein] synthase III C-terminal domain-containing protein [Acinetobacter nematophilus]|uniref:3-oxoacyl-[acyl-carrier-protein] synthase III C-terminal domain-containing protein n=1 Tax=Acinetobacter nematophilus TaxID=2994642 RepID=UPI003AF6B154